MDIYLDTYTLQKWSNSTLCKDELSALDDIFAIQTNKLVLSPNHLWEISSRSDVKSAIAIGRFLDQFPNKIYIKSSDDIEQIEVMRGFKLYSGVETTSAHVFDKSLVHTLACNLDALPLRMAFENATIESLIRFVSDPKATAKHKIHTEQKLVPWAIYNNQYTDGLSVEQWKKIIFERIKIKLETLIINKNLSPLKLLADEGFIKFMLSEYQKAIPGLMLATCTQYYMHRNSKKFEPGDISDLSMITFVPYVDYITLDKTNYTRVTSTIRSLLPTLKDEEMPKLNYSVKQLYEKLTKSN